MDAFQPATDADTLTETTPTVVMLSNVQFIKDIRTAILAADIIVNTLELTTYRLLIYGARDREPAYDAAMARLIASCSLTQNVELAGYGDARAALRGASLFVNSSLSEGLPLAIAEAALAGVPIVATAVGATALVLTDPDDGATRYGDIVPPNDAAALARAQIALLAMAGPRWARFADSDAHLPDVLTARDAAWLQARMRDAAPARRRLGLRGREVVLRGFHGKRYLREHEQMYWVQWHLARMRGVDGLADVAGLGDGVCWRDLETEGQGGEGRVVGDGLGWRAFQGKERGRQPRRRRLRKAGKGRDESEGKVTTPL